MSRDNPEAGDLFYHFGSVILLVNHGPDLRNVICEGGARLGMLVNREMTSKLKPKDYIGPISIFADALASNPLSFPQPDKLELGQIWLVGEADLILLYKDRDKNILANVHLSEGDEYVRGDLEGGVRLFEYLKGERYLGNIDVLATKLLKVHNR